MQYTNDEAALHWDMLAMRDLGRDLTFEDNGKIPVANRPERAWMVTFGGDRCFGPNTHDSCEVFQRGFREALHRLERQANG
jgi:hypothetical protein